MSQHSRWRFWRFLIPVVKAALTVLRVARSAIGIHETFFVGGLLLAGYGGAQISRPWTLVAIGVVLAGTGITPILLKRSAS